MGTPLIKICGLRTTEAVTCAVRAGADAVGFVFAPGSPRVVTAGHVRELVRLVPSAIETVGVFRAQPIDEVIAIASEAGVSTIQFHGYEPYEDVQRAKAEGFRVMRAFAIDEFTRLSEVDRELWHTERLLIDAVEPGGGTPFNPGELQHHVPVGEWLLAGGLTPTNVAGLIARLRPSGVDVSSGVESRRGVKSPALIETFIRVVRHAYASA